MKFFSPLFKYLIYTIHPNKSIELIKRFWRIYISPPPETYKFSPPELSPQVYTKIDEIKTACQPKQVAISKDRGTAFVACMKAQTLQVFSLKGKLSLLDEISFPQQCVEVTTTHKLVLVTSTNFSKNRSRDYLWIIDPRTRKILSSLPTEGSWSKIAAVTPDNSQCLVSNWNSNSISVVNISNPNHPHVTQLIEVGGTPRGIGITSDSKIAVVANFYPGNVVQLIRNNQKWSVTCTSKPFEFPNYSGNLRHVLISPDDRLAYISNKGRNLIHTWSIPDRSFLLSSSVGKGPNTICFANARNQILVSCSQSRHVYLLDSQSGQILGISPQTGKNPTGLCSISNSEFLVTGFDSNNLQKYSLIKRIATHQKWPKLVPPARPWPQS